MAEVYDLIERAHRGEKEARDQLVYENTGLVWSVVRRFSYAGVEKEELFQIGVIGLLKAIDRFDTSYRVCFSTYAVPAISGELKRFLRDDGPMKISRSIVEHQRKIREFTQQWEREQRENPQEDCRERKLTMEVLQRGTGLTREEIILAQESARPVESLYQTVYEERGGELLLIDQVAQEGESFDENTVNHVVLSQALGNLGYRERQLIYCRYFKDMTQAATARELGMNQVQVSRTEKKILLKMRKMFGDYPSE